MNLAGDISISTGGTQVWVGFAWRDLHLNIQSPAKASMTKRIKLSAIPIILTDHEVKCNGDDTFSMSFLALSKATSGNRKEESSIN